MASLRFTSKYVNRAVTVFHGNAFSWETRTALILVLAVQALIEALDWAKDKAETKGSKKKGTRHAQLA